MPESPRFLIYRRRDEEALDILKKMHTEHGDETFALAEFHQIRAQIEYERENRLGITAIWSKPSFRKRFLLVFSYAIACMYVDTMPQSGLLRDC